MKLTRGKYKNGQEWLELSQELAIDKTAKVFGLTECKRITTSGWNSLIYSLSILVNFSEIPVFHFNSLHFTCTSTY